MSHYSLHLLNCHFCSPSVQRTLLFTDCLNILQPLQVLSCLMETRELPLFMHLLKPGKKTGSIPFFFSCLFYQYADEPEVNIVVFAQPGAIDLQALT